MNSKDLCLIDEVDKLIEAGIDSFKIEGRMKTPFYVATVIRSYRQVIDSYYEGNFSKELSKKYFDEISKASHRHFTKGFFIINQMKMTKYTALLHILEIMTL